MRDFFCGCVRKSALALFAASLTSVAFAQDSSWRVGKSSGDVWVATSEVQTVSLTQDAVLKPGDKISTGRNGRVLLVRGDETILVAPNSAIGIPLEKKDGLATTITQQAGSILLNVEKKNVQHFAVETPYLAAVVKGTQFRVTVNSAGSRVDVIGGSVEVADFKTGQFAMVAPGQAAQVSVRGASGLSLQGPGTLAPIQKGAPRESSVQRVPVPRGGLTAPQITAPMERRAVAPANPGTEKKLIAAKPVIKPTMRIAAPLGEVKMDFKKVTKGLARATSVATVDAKASKDTVWSSGDLTPGNGASKEAGKGNNGSASANASVNSSASSSSASSASASASGLGNGNGNGNAYGQNKDDKEKKEKKPKK